MGHAHATYEQELDLNNGLIDTPEYTGKHEVGSGGACRLPPIGRPGSVADHDAKGVYRLGVADHDPQCERCGRVLDPTP